MKFVGIKLCIPRVYLESSFREENYSPFPIRRSHVSKGAGKVKIKVIFFKPKMVRIKPNTEIHVTLSKTLPENKTNHDLILKVKIEKWDISPLLQPQVKIRS